MAEGARLRPFTYVGHPAAPEKGYSRRCSPPLLPCIPPQNFPLLPEKPLLSTVVPPEEELDFSIFRRVWVM